MKTSIRGYVAQFETETMKQQLKILGIHFLDYLKASIRDSENDLI